MSRVWNADVDTSTTGQDAILQNQDRLNALKSMYSGAGDPASETVAYMAAVDTSANLVRQRDAADAAFVTIGNLKHNDSGSTDTDHWGHQRALMNNVGNSGAAQTVDFSDGSTQRIVLTADCTLTFSNPRMAEVVHLIIVQDGTGSWTITWPAAALFVGGDPTPTAAAGAIDAYTFVYDPENSKYLCISQAKNLT